MDWFPIIISSLITVITLSVLVAIFIFGVSIGRRAEREEVDKDPLLRKLLREHRLGEIQGKAEHI